METVELVGNDGSFLTQLPGIMVVAEAIPDNNVLPIDCFSIHIARPQQAIIAGYR